MAKLIPKLLYILNQREQIQAGAIFVLMILGAAIEMIGIGLIPPFVHLLSQPEIIQQNKYLLWIYQLTGMDSIQKFLILVAGGLIIFYVLKNIYLSLLTYVQFKFLFNQQVSLSDRLFSSYLYSPYTFHLERNPAELILNLSNEVLVMFINVLIPGIVLLAELLVTTFVAVFLIIMEPLASLVSVGVIGTATVGFYSLIRKRTGKLGEVRHYHSSKMIQWINQGLGGLKEVKVLGREKFFLNTFTAHSSEYAIASQFVQTISVLPRLFLESIAVITILLIVVVVLVQGRNMQSILPTLSLFAIAAFRLMPSANRILASLTTIRYFSYSVDVIYRDLLALEKTRNLTPPVPKYVEKSIDFNKIIEIKNVYYQYPNAKNPAVNGISLSIPKSHSIGLVGSSGAGKTTMVDLILGLLTPTQGEILVDGENIQTNLNSWQRQIGYIPQNIYLSDDTIRSNIAFGLPIEEIDEQKVWAAIEAAQLKELVYSLPEQLDTLVGDRGIRLSGGQRQRIGIARALYHDPEILVMDEATAALDNETEREITKALERLSGEKTIIMIAHRLSTVKKCDRLYFLQSGKISCSGTYHQLLARSLEFQAMANID